MQFWRTDNVILDRDRQRPVKQNTKPRNKSARMRDLVYNRSQSKSDCSINGIGTNDYLERGKTESLP